MKFTKALFITLVLAMGAIVWVRADTVPLFGVGSSIEVKVEAPCGGFWPWQTEVLTPFTRRDEVWVMSRCWDGRVFMTKFPNMERVPGPINK